MEVAGERKSVWRRSVHYEYTYDGVVVEDMVVDRDLFSYISSWLDGVEARYPDDVVKNVVSIFLKSIRELSVHRVGEFVSYGDYHIFDALARQLRQEYLDPHFEPRPYMVVLYGPPGTGKTTWARQVAKKYLVRSGVLRGLYLELSIGDITSKWAGVPLHTMRSVLEAIRTRDYMSILLVDEADAVFTRPRDTSCGYSLEQMQLIADMKSQLSFITNHSYPTLIVLTTNYKDAIARADEALADRVIAWIEVPPPSLDVKEKIMSRALHGVMKTLLRSGTPQGELAKFRALLYNSMLFWVGDEPRNLGVSFRWYTPILPFDADYLVGLLSAWGWNPLDLKLDYTCMEAIRVWDPGNPVYKVYARVLVTLVELYKLYVTGKHGVPKSFLRAYKVLKRGIEDTARLHVHMYVDGMDALAKLVKYADSFRRKQEYGKAYDILERIGYTFPDGREDTGKLVEGLKNKYQWFLLRSLFFHPVNPVLLLHAMARYAVSKEFTQLVNDILSLSAPITWGIRFIYAPTVFGTPKYMDKPYTMATLFRVKLDRYNKLIVEELREGELLAPLRTMYMEPNLERAWEKARRLADNVPEDYQPYVKLCLIPLRELHPVIHAGNPEEKAEKLYTAVKDRKALEERMWKTVEELGIPEDVYVFPMTDAIYKWGDTGEVILHTSSFVADPYLSDVFADNLYHPATHIDDIGSVFAGIKIRSRELVEKKENMVT